MGQSYDVGTNLICIRGNEDFKEGDTYMVRSADFQNRVYHFIGERGVCVVVMDEVDSYFEKNDYYPFELAHG